MTDRIQKIIGNLKHYPDDTLITIKDVDDEEFMIVDCNYSEHTLILQKKTTYTVLEFLRKLNNYDGAAVFLMDADEEQAFTITDFQSEGNALTIVIDEITDEEDQI